MAPSVYDHAVRVRHPAAEGGIMSLTLTCPYFWLIGDKGPDEIQSTDFEGDYEVECIMDEVCSCHIMRLSPTAAVTLHSYTCTHMRVRHLK